MIIIVLAGLTASGKDTAAEIFREQGFNKLNYSDVLKIEAEKRGLEIKQDTLLNLGNELRSTRGKEVLSELLMEEFRKRGWTKAIACGVRDIDEYNFWKTSGEDHYLVVIDADPETRFERMRSRRRPEDPRTFEEFLEYDKKERAIGFDRIKEQARFVVENNGTIGELREKIKEIIKEL